MSTAEGIRLTVGMAHYNDFQGLWNTCMGLKLMHPEIAKQIDLVVVDNNPNSSQGQRASAFINGWMKDVFHSARWIPMDEPRGTSPPRDRVFREAMAPVVMCIDSHIFIEQGMLARFLEYAEAQGPDCRDMWAGPILYDNGDLLGTHFAYGFRAEMLGKWETDDRGRNPESPPFEIPGQGLGLFAMRKDHWVGFNPALRGFGGEELCVHEKVRQRGGKTMCLPFLRWNHFFRDEGAAPYPLMLHEKVRNYLIWFDEIGWNRQEIYNHFVSLDTFGLALPEHLANEHGVDPRDMKGKTTAELEVLHRKRKLTEEEWERLAADPIGTLDPRKVKGPKYSVIRPEQPPARATIDQIYDFIQKVPRDLNEHMPELRRLAAKCNHITEFSKRRESTAALLAGRPKTLVSYQLEADVLLPAMHAACGKELSDNLERDEPIERVCQTFTTHTDVRADSLLVEPIEETDLLFIHSVHHADRLYNELKRHGEQVQKYIVLMSTEAFGKKAEGDGPGLLVGWAKWHAEHPEWKRVAHFTNQYGLTVFSKVPGERSIDAGPGTELKSIIASLGINPAPGCDCNKRAREMDAMGPDGCRENFDMIIGWLKEGQQRWGWKDRLTAAAKAVTTGLAFQVNWSDPLPDLVQMAIDRADAKENPGKAVAA